jgi:hypothetical protein
MCCHLAGTMVGIDIAYNLHSTYGNWFPGVKPLVVQVCSLVKIASDHLSDYTEAGLLVRILACEHIVDAHLAYSL